MDFIRDYNEMTAIQTVIETVNDSAHIEHPWHAPLRVLEESTPEVSSGGYYWGTSIVKGTLEFQEFNKRTRAPIGKEMRKRFVYNWTLFTDITLTDLLLFTGSGTFQQAKNYQCSQS